MPSNRDPFTPEFARIRPSILARDLYRCRKCGYDSELEVHHVLGYTINTPDALVTLCMPCHDIAPNGMVEYYEWEHSGISGIAHALQYVAARCPDIPLEMIYKTLRSSYVLRKLRTAIDMLAGKHRKKKLGQRCEGRKPYGTHPGEREGLERILRLRRDGMPYIHIARTLDAEGFKSREGKPWQTSTIRKVILDNERQPALFQ